MKNQLEYILNFENSIINNYCDSFNTYWNFINNLNEVIKTIGMNLDKEKYKEVMPNVWISKSANVHNTATIIGPCIIDDFAEVRVNAYIRGSAIIGKNCIVGNSSEIKNSVLFDEAKVPHFNYIGDSILGYKSHFGAGAITSNVKSDESIINITLNEQKYNTNMHKLGSVVGDNSEIGCNCVLNPGVIIGRNSNIYPLTMVRGEIGNDKIVKSMDNIITKEKEKVLCKYI